MYYLLYTDVRVHRNNENERNEELEEGEQANS